MPDTCYFDFIYEPITPFRKLIFNKLISKVRGQKILDLGCGQVGHYWAFGYQDKVEMIDFLDYHQTNIEILSEKITSINPEKLEQNFADTIKFLKDSKTISLQSYQEITFNLVSKVRQIETFNFLKDKWTEKYDTILAIESLECVNTEEDFILALNNTAKLLEKNGKLLALILRYNLPDNYTKKLISEKMEGGLNPNQKQLEKMFENSDLSLDWIKNIPVPELHNYPEAIFLEAKLK
jgi:cyclopropane fatty-acyl-phospholipid synthase-like methyltransferase